MSANAPSWFAGEPADRARLDPILAAGLDPESAIHHNARRTVYRIDPPSPRDPAESLALKIHHTASGKHPLREVLKRAIGRSPARREWRSLRALADAGVAVPSPRAWGRLASGDEFIVSRFIEGVPLAKSLEDADESTSDALLDALTSLIDSLHAAGHRHGDLHVGNLYVASPLEREDAADGARCADTAPGTRNVRLFLLDVQRARRLRGASDRLSDFARLEFSLAKSGCSADRRARVRARLEIGREFDTALQSFVSDYARGRARRLLRPGRRLAACAIGSRRGQRDRSLDAPTLTSLIDEADRTSGQARREGRVRLVEAKAGDRPVLVKHFEAGSLRRALADLLRGSPAARGFRRGQTHALVSARAALPLAYLEERRCLVPVRSWLVLEKVGDLDLDQLEPADAAEARHLARALGTWLAQAHAFGLSHHDMKASNIRVGDRDRQRFWWIDLEDLVGPRVLSQGDRFRALAQLNASLADEAFDLAARLAFLEAYEAGLPLHDGRGPDPTQPARQAARRIARDSLGRRHRWRGQGCACLESEPGRPLAPDVPDAPSGP